MKLPGKLIDLSHTLTENMPVFGEKCDFHLRTLKNIETDQPISFLTQQLQMTAGMGTHLDAPAHIKPNGRGVHDIPVETLLSPLIVINVSAAAQADFLLSVTHIHTFESQYGPIAPHSFVVVYTGWDRFWGTPDFRNNLQFPSISAEAAELLLARNIVGLGIDTLSPDCPQSGYPVHALVLGQDKYILECVANASKMPCQGAYIVVAPLKLKDGAEAPARVFGLII